MGDLRRSIIFKGLMVVCAVVQMAVIMPHHHHYASDAACINPFHCLADYQSGGAEHDCAPGLSADHSREDSRHGDCCPGDTHRHEKPGEHCSMTPPDMNPPAREKVAFAAPVLDISYTALPLEAAGSCPACRDHGHGGQVADCSVWLGTIALYTEFCTSAIPPRAPSFRV